ncbi:predicted protein [Botrytis cinerea T4]|uniref:Uncharacterized protein n=1 Tax=Botryotinia fuckeliana (strain T4) TaxID=999810 RepID=G2Y1F7_BOTF4|nr:predicted protein [Botrytis cinerea T4]
MPREYMAPSGWLSHKIADSLHEVTDSMADWLSPNRKDRKKCAVSFRHCKLV